MLLGIRTSLNKISVRSAVPRHYIYIYIYLHFFYFIQLAILNGRLPNIYILQYLFKFFPCQHNYKVLQLLYIILLSILFRAIGHINIQSQSLNCPLITYYYELSRNLNTAACWIRFLYSILWYKYCIQIDEFRISADVSVFTTDR